jgi:hypothetical protein
MFIIHLDKGVAIGDTVDGRINGKPARVTRRAEALVIEPGDVRQILKEIDSGKLTCSICADADGTSDLAVIAPERWRP